MFLQELLILNLIDIGGKLLRMEYSEVNIVIINESLDINWI